MVFRKSMNTAHGVGRSDGGRGWASGGRAVHVWLASVAAHAACEPVLRTLLSPAELGRADRFRFAEHRTRYVVAHGVLRWLLGRYLGEEPAGLRLLAAAGGTERPGADQVQPVARR